MAKQPKSEKPKDQHKVKATGVRLPPEEKLALNRMAKLEGRKINEVIRFALWFYANEHNHAWPGNPREIKD